ncbi:conserved hypothetical protein [Theileria orientalis strain Shintoku]|uniref:Mediator of RNA polymerase II transcription subunit 14 n=1 Tax=Theileria orientalis strain Shintoku TaxID=869250 RepID=J4D7I4_THEOR|nr:conserved hypothetical protein [Theileria orientalis strain Shintoku]BAM40205.1 conserved hypothetical protein [Theileria orientalis strain Shintoku]|eukprot:XP_009690506.1 conserved hypothetical protein [Theileria orientalis strain Shintoku]
MGDEIEDFVGVSYVDLLSKSLTRCIIDWKCFGERIVSETNKNNLRIALIQYCRGQREIFLKLKVLFDLVKYQKNIDKMLQYSTQYDEYIENSIQDLSKNICVIENNIMPAPNVSLGVDLLNTCTYTRIPTMIGEISKSSVDNTIPVMKIDPETIDLCLNRLKIHFYVLFKLSECSRVCKVDFNNGVCCFTREDFFHIELLYDFSQYQITKLKLFINNYYVNNMVNIMNYVLNHQDRKVDNIFDIIYKITNSYIGKVIMKYLYKQVINYNNNKYIVYNYEHVLNDGNYSVNETSEEKEVVERLKVECYNKYKSKKERGLVMVFTRKENGDVNLRVDQLNLSYPGVHDYKFDYWLHKMSDELEKHQLEAYRSKAEVVNNQYNQLLELIESECGNKKVTEGNNLFKHHRVSELYLIEDGAELKNGVKLEELEQNKLGQLRREEQVWMNRFNGSLNFHDYTGEFNLNEAHGILKLNKITQLLDVKYRKYEPFAMNGAPEMNVTCPVCRLESELYSMNRYGDKSYGKVKAGHEHKVDVKVEVKREPDVKASSHEGMELDENREERNYDEEDIDNHLVSVLLANNKCLMHNSNNNLHVLGMYQVHPLYGGKLPDRKANVYINEEDNDFGLRLVLNVLVHDYVTIGNNLAVFDGTSNAVGTVELECLYQESMKERLLTILSGLLSLEFMNRKQGWERGFSSDAYSRHFVTEPIDREVRLAVFKFSELNLSVTFKDGLFYKVCKDGRETMFGNDQHPDAFMSKILSQGRR